MKIFCFKINVSSTSQGGGVPFAGLIHKKEPIRDQHPLLKGRCWCFLFAFFVLETWGMFLWFGCFVLCYLVLFSCFCGAFFGCFLVFFFLFSGFEESFVCLFTVACVIFKFRVVFDSVDWFLGGVYWFGIVSSKRFWLAFQLVLDGFFQLVLAGFLVERFPFLVTKSGVLEGSPSCFTTRSFQKRATLAAETYLNLDR